VLGPAEENIDPVLGPEESNFPVSVTPDERDYDDFRFFAPKIIDRGHTKEVTQLFLLQRIPFVLRLWSGPVLDMVLTVKPVLDQGVLISIADNDFEVIPHC